MKARRDSVVCCSFPRSARATLDRWHNRSGHEQLLSSQQLPTGCFRRGIRGDKGGTGGSRVTGDSRPVVIGNVVVWAKLCEELGQWCSAEICCWAFESFSRLCFAPTPAATFEPPLNTSFAGSRFFNRRLSCERPKPLGLR